MEPDLVVVGDAMLDVSVRSDALAAGGDVHGEVRIRPAGAGSNAAVWAATRGARVRFFGRVGDDLGGHLLLQALSERRVEAVLATDREARTGAMLVVREKGERSMIADRGANARLSPDDLPEHLEAGAVLLSGYLLFDQGSEEAAAAALERATGAWTAVDAASWPLIERYGPGRFLESTGRANLLVANEREARALVPGAGPLDEVVIELGRRYDVVCVKRGRDGAVAFAEGHKTEARATVVAEADPTGAGDAFDGVLLTELALGTSLDRALAAACHAGADAAASFETWPER